MSTLSLFNARATLQGVEILKGVTFEVTGGKMVGLIGPNGAGKTTVVRALLGLQALTSGSALINGRPTSDMTTRERALSVSYLPQSRKLAWPIGVREAVALGRFAQGGALGKLSIQDAKAVDEALARCDLEDFARRSVASLSGGELARVHIARALAARAPALIADEPIAALDPRHGFDVLGLLRDQARAGTAVLVVLHDLSLAARFCDEIIMLNHGKLMVHDTPRRAMTPQTLASVFGIETDWDRDNLRTLGTAPFSATPLS